MRVVVLHESPGADSPAGRFREAAAEFNRGLDVRLRFLDVGFELRVLPVRADDEDAPAALVEVLRAFQPRVVLAFGGGPRVAECAAAAVKEGAVLAVVAGGDQEDRSAAGVARLASILFVPEGRDAPASAPGARLLSLPGPEESAAALVDRLVRSVRDGRNA